MEGMNEPESYDSKAAIQQALALAPAIDRVRGRVQIIEQALAVLHFQKPATVEYYTVRAEALAQLARIDQAANRYRARAEQGGVIFTRAADSLSGLSAHCRALLLRLEGGS